MHKAPAPVDRRFRLARLWSNKHLKEIGCLFEGKVINVSAGEDDDKEGNTYALYFPKSRAYWLSNYNPGSFRGHQGRDNELLVDLTQELPSDLLGKFDVVFNHTTLEHIFDVTTAFRNICLLSRDIVILIVPFAQVQHENDGYEDFWRFTPTCVRRLFEQNGFHVMYEAANNDENAPVYLFVVASRSPQKWSDKMPKHTCFHPAGEWIGKSEPEKRKSWVRIMLNKFLRFSGRRLRLVFHFLRDKAFKTLSHAS